MTRVLIVDDEPDIVGNLSDILTEFGYEVEGAVTAKEALDKVEQDNFDVALLDLRMPEMNGIELYREIKNRQPEIAAILVTAYADEVSTSRAEESGIDEIIDKPVDLPRLVGSVNEAADQPLLLIVDDDEDLCQSMWDTLRDQGFRVGIAHRPSEAHEKLNQRDYQVLLLDMKLPEGGGSEVFYHLQRRTPRPRTLLITGFPQELAPDIDAVLQQGADAVCYKPFEVPKLLEAIHRLCVTGPPENG